MCDALRNNKVVHSFNYTHVPTLRPANATQNDFYSPKLNSSSGFKNKYKDIILKREIHSFLP